MREAPEDVPGVCRRVPGPQYRLRRASEPSAEVGGVLLGTTEIRAPVDIGRCRRTANDFRHEGLPRTFTRLQRSDIRMTPLRLPTTRVVLAKGACLSAGAAVEDGRWTMEEDDAINDSPGNKTSATP